VSGVRCQVGGRIPLLLAVLSGLLLAIPFNYGRLWIFAWFGFVPVFFALNNKSLKQAFFLFFTTGIIFWAGTIYWLVHVTLAGTIVLVLYLSLYFALFGLIIRPCTKSSTPYALIFIPSVWVLLEYARGHLMTGFPWAILGYSQYLNLPVIQVADITGAWGISFLIIMVNVALVEVLGARRQVAVFCILFIAAVLGYGYFKLYLPSNTYHPTPVKISVIQGNIPQELKWDPDARVPIVEKYSALTRQASRDKADLIIWPEAALPVIPQEEPQLFEEVRGLAKDINTPLLLGAVTYSKGNYYNGGILISDSGGISGQYNKIHLVPFGEYIPLRKLLPFLETVVPIGDVAAGKEYTIFQIPNSKFRHRRTSLRLAQIPNFSVLICFEDVFPALARRFVRQGADFLINITNDGWYKETPAGYQHLQASVLRAVENRVFVVRSANTGVSAFIEPSGRIISTVRDASGKEIFISGYKTDDIRFGARRLSPYTKSGDIFILGCLIFVIYGIIMPKKEKHV